MFAKGSTIRTTLDFLNAEGGPDLVGRVLTDLTPATRAAIAGIEPTNELPYATLQDLWRAADALLGADPTWAERAGAFSIESLGMQLYRGILLKRSPDEFLTQSVSLFQLYYHPGDMTVVFEEPGMKLYINGELVGGSDIILEMYKSGELQKIVGESAKATG